MTNHCLFDTIIQFHKVNQSQMKTKIKVKKIPDTKTKVPINSPEHRIWEIKREFAEDVISENGSFSVDVFEMWEEEKD